MGKQRKQSRRTVGRLLGVGLERGRLQPQQLVRRQRKLLPKERRIQTKTQKKLITPHCSIKQNYLVSYQSFEHFD